MNDVKKPLIISDCTVYGEDLFFFTKQYNALYKLSVKDGKIYFLSRIPNEDRFGEDLVEAVHYYNGKIYLSPRKMNSNKIWIYDLTISEWDYIEVEFDGVKAPKEIIAYSVLNNENLILIGCYYNGIIKINLKDNSCVYFKGILDDEDTIHSLFCCEYDGRSIFVPSPNKNYVSKINLETMDVKKFVVGSDEFKFTGICKFDDIYWLSPRERIPYIIKWTPDGKEEKYKIPIELMKNGDYIFSGIKRIGNSIYVFGNDNKKSLLYDGQSFENLKVKDGIYTYIKSENRNSIVQDNTGNLVIDWDDINYRICLEKSIDDLCNEEIAGKIDTIYEKESVSFEMYIKLLQQR